MKFILNIFCIFFLIGCSETTFLINSAKRIGSWGDDPVYKVGNPYKINGQWYYPAVDYQYDETGMASWYGPGFHGKTTANGEVFDQNKISAAHRTLPMPSVVKVTNLENGMVLNNVRINDEDLLQNNNDLSKKAAEELGFIKNGVAKVRVEILESESRKYATFEVQDDRIAESAEITKVNKKDLLPKFVEKKEAEQTNLKDDSRNSILTDKELLIQVGAFTDHRNAKLLIKKLTEFKAYINRVFINNKYLYRVRIGPINDLERANEVKQKLFDLGYTSSHLVMK